MAQLFSRSIDVTSPEETTSLAMCLARRLSKGDFIALYGDLGAGKSHFARALIRTLTNPEAEVPSPTFTLVQYYQGRIEGREIDICHADFYRLTSPEEIAELGILEFPGVVLAEWPERMGTLLPGELLKIHFLPGDNEMARKIIFEGSAKWVDRLAHINKGEE